MTDVKQQTVVAELKEPNHLDFKIKNQYGEWVWRNPQAMDRYADEWDMWYNQEQQKLKQAK
jgi:hypothetical protein